MAPTVPLHLQMMKKNVLFWAFSYPVSALWEHRPTMVIDNLDLLFPFFHNSTCHKGQRTEPKQSINRALPPLLCPVLFWLPLTNHDCSLGTDYTEPCVCEARKREGTSSTKLTPDLLHVDTSQTISHRTAHKRLAPSFHNDTIFTDKLFQRKKNIWCNHLLEKCGHEHWPERLKDITGEFSHWRGSSRSSRFLFTAQGWNGVCASTSRHLLHLTLTRTFVNELAVFHLRSK